MKIEITKAELDDIDFIKSIADANKDKIGFIRRNTLIEQQKRNWMIVAKIASKGVGFVSYRHRKDDQTTIYEICVAEDHRNNGIGTQLMNALVFEACELGKERIVLKCPSDLVANNFYANYGFLFKALEKGKNRPLNVWELLLKQIRQPSDSIIM